MHPQNIHHKVSTGYASAVTQCVLLSSWLRLSWAHTILLYDGNEEDLSPLDAQQEVPEARAYWGDIIWRQRLQRDRGWGAREQRKRLSLSRL